MKQLTLSLLFSFLTMLLYGQAIHVVNNTGDAAPEHYETLEDAYLLSNDGDIILLHGSITPYSFGGDMNKRLTIYGPGFNLSSYPDTLTTEVNTVTISAVTLVDGAQGSAFFGLTIDDVRIDTDDIIFKGCEFTGSANTNTTAIKNNILMEGCYAGVKLDFTNTVDLTIKNSIMGNIATPTNDMPGLDIDHCVFNIPNIKNSNVSNSVSLYTSNLINSNTNFNHTTFSYINIPANCTSCINSATCVVLYDNCSDDKELKYLNLKAGSPALNAASDGSDIGLTGGIEPYKKSGIPDAPYINELIVPFTPASNSMDVYIKATAEQ